MCLFRLFRSVKGQFRFHVRACFNECYNNVKREHNEVLKTDPISWGIIFISEVSSLKTKLVSDPDLSQFSLLHNFDPYEIIEEEFIRVSRKATRKSLGINI